jgi:putative spermidine/putrescine transport system permease protein
MKSKNILSWAVLFLFVIIVMLFLLSPIICIIGASFGSAEHFSFPPENFTLKWYLRALKNKEHIRSLRASLSVALLSTVLTTVLCLPASIALVKTQNPFLKKLKTLFIAPVIMPSLVWGLGLLLCMGTLRLQGSLLIVGLAHTVMMTPYMIRLVGASLDEFNYALEDAAASLGANPFRVFFHITLPGVSQGIIVGAVFCYMLSFSDLIITLFVSSSRFTTFPVRVFSAMRTEGVDPIVLSYSAIIIVLVLLLSIVSEKFLHWSDQFRATF